MDQRWTYFAGITLDHEDLMLVSIKEIVENPNPPPPEPAVSSSESGDSSGEDQRVDSSGRKRRKKRKKHKASDGETPAKSQKTGNDDLDDSDYETRTDIDNPDTPSATPAKQNLFSDTPNAGNTENSNMESNDSFFTLQDIKQDHSDDDLIEIIKEEPGLSSSRGNAPHIVSIQSIPSAGGGPHHQVLGSVSQSQMSAMNPNMPSPSGPLPPGQMPPGLQMAPGQYEDLMQVCKIAIWLLNSQDSLFFFILKNNLLAKLIPLPTKGPRYIEIETVETSTTCSFFYCFLVAYQYKM